MHSRSLPGGLEVSKRISVRSSSTGRLWSASAALVALCAIRFAGLEQVLGNADPAFSFPAVLRQPLVHEREPPLTALAKGSDLDCAPLDHGLAAGLVPRPG